MKKATAVYIINTSNEVLLGLKTQFVGVNKRFGYGGKLEPQDNASLLACSVREVKEEAGGLTIKEEDLIHVGCIQFFKGGITKPDEPLFEVDFYICYEFEGLPSSTKEMIDPKWYPIEKLPLDEFKSGDELFVPRILHGEKVSGWIWFSDNATETLLNHDLQFT